MFNKKVMMLAIFLVSLLAISAVNAADNATSDVVSVDEVINENNDVELDEEILSDDSGEKDNVLSVGVNDDVLAADSPPHNKYSVSVSDVSVNYGSSGSIRMSISSASSSYYYRYDFYLKIYDSNNNLKVSKNYYSTSSSNYITHTLDANSLSPGVYTIKIVNYEDDYVMDTAKLTVKANLPYSAYSVSVSDVSVNYGSSGSISMSISPASSSYYYRYDFYLKVYNSNGVEKLSQRYYGTTSTYSKTYSLSSNSLPLGVYTIKIINSYDSHVMSTAKLTVQNIKIQSQSVTGNCNENIQYKVRVSENDNYISGKEVVFTYDGKQTSVITDSQGYATLNTHLKAGTYEVTAKCSGVSNKNTIKINSVYIENDYKNVYVKSLTGYYGADNIIKYGWAGNLKGYFKLYKGNKLLDSKPFNSNGYIYDYMSYDKHDESYSGSPIKSIGTYRAVITSENGKVLAQAKIKINKAPTRIFAPSFSDKIGSRDYIYAEVVNPKEKTVYKTSGTVKFKIAGKTYTTKLKKGVTSKIIKLPLKAKTYKCTVKFLGNSNYKASSAKFKIKLNSGKVTILNKNRSVKVGKYTVKLTSSQYRTLVNSFNKDKSKYLKIKTGYTYKVKVPYTKTVKTYKTTKAVKTWYGGSYMPMINHMIDNGWTKVSEYTYNQPNPQNRYGIGLSSYTIAVCKWVKVSYKTAYKTKEYPVYAHISYNKKYTLPSIEVYSHGKSLNWKHLAIA